MASTTIPDTLIDLLTTDIVASIATVRPDGAPAIVDAGARIGRPSIAEENLRSRENSKGKDRRKPLAARLLYATFCTRPEWMQSVQTRIRRTCPSMRALTRCKLGRQRLFVLLLAWLTLFPTE